MSPDLEIQEVFLLALDGGNDGLEVHCRVVAEAPLWLASGGKLLMETSQRESVKTAQLFSDHVCICPHTPDEHCSCRKPSPGMLLNAASEHGLTLDKCAVIGHRWTDMVAANAAGCVKVLVTSGSGKRVYLRYQNGEYFGDWLKAIPNYVADNVLDAVKWLITQQRAG